MGHNLSFSVCTKRILVAQAAGQTNKECTEIDMSGYNAVRIIALFGATANTGTASIKIVGSDISGNYDDTNVLSSSENVTPITDDNKLVILDIYRPTKRYLKASVIRGVANTSIDGVIAELYHAENRPVVADNSVAKQVVSNN